VPRSILVVDDDPDVRTLLGEILRADGHAVREAANGRQALHELRHHPQLVLLDVILPDMDGFTVVEAIKSRSGPFLPVILLTALDDPASRARGIAAGADEVVGKPVQPFELKLRVRAMLRIGQLAGELHRANRQLALLARTDELTHVRNRRGIMVQLEREFHRAARYGAPFSVIQLDLDHFKRVNDERGHAAGDELLKAVARALRHALRQVDSVGRIGGEEFVVVAPETGGRDARALAERLRLEVEKTGITVSCGVATLGDVLARDAGELLAWADQALYRAKMSGRNRTEVAMGARQDISARTRR
jgi:two-component system chemotaxis response regulator CheY